MCSNIKNGYTQFPNYEVLNCDPVELFRRNRLRSLKKHHFSTTWVYVCTIDESSYRTIILKNLRSTMKRFIQL